MATKTAKTNPVADASALVRKREAELSEAVEAELGFERRLMEGDDSVTTSDMTEAGNASKRARLLLEAARKNLATAKAEASKAAAEASPDAAELVADLFAENQFAFGAFGVPVNIVSKLSDTAPSNLPTIEITQDQATELTLSGTVNGRAVVAFFTDASVSLAHAETLGAKLPEVVRSGDRAIEAQRFSAGAPLDLGNGVTRRTIGFAIRGIKPEIPTITGEPADHVIQGFGRNVVSAVKQRSGYVKRKGVGFGNGDASGYVSTVHASLGSVALADSRESGGIVRRTLEVDFTAQVMNVHGDEVKQRVSQVIEGMAGEFESYLGRIESASVQRIQAGGDARGFSARFVVVSKRG
ncbi:hypothetical protein [Streptomyces coelicoflavus]|uniref:hypothetical protein n=1 Tax=Streptomyces coelicoflavus TaxID=285562 RepID=UPI003682F7EF